MDHSQYLRKKIESAGRFIARMKTVDSSFLTLQRQQKSASAGYNASSTLPPMTGYCPSDAMNAGGLNTKRGFTSVSKQSPHQNLILRSAGCVTCHAVDYSIVSPGIEIDCSGIVIVSGGGSNPGPGPAARWTWTRQSQPTTGPPSDEIWISIASSSDGSRLSVCSLSTGTRGKIWTAVRSGSSWTWTDQSASLFNDTGVSTDANWTSIASSADGLVLAACGTSGVDAPRVGVFSNGSWTWSIVTPGNTYTWTSIAISADGKRMAACESTGTYGGFTAVYTGSFPTGSWSTPLQFTDTTVATTQWISICSDSTGTKLAAISNNSLVYTGVFVGFTWTWTDVTPPSVVFPTSIASSSDGNMLAVGSANSIWVGVYSSGSWTWDTINSPSNISGPSWTSIALSADGTRMVVCDGNNIQNCYTGVEGSGGVWAWTIQTGAPPLMPGGYAACSSADGLSIATCESSGSYGVYTGVYA